MSTPAAIIPRKYAVINDGRGSLISLHAGKPVVEQRVIELAIEQGVDFDLPQTVIIAGGSGEVTTEDGETLRINAGELTLKVDSGVVRAVVAGKRITLLRIGGVELHT